MSDQQNLPDVEQVNGFDLGFSYLRFYRQYPEIGLPTANQVGDVNGYQAFENAELSWDGSKVGVRWTGDENQRPAWMDGKNTGKFEV